MDQQDIFRLLLLVLLIANRQLSDDKTEDTWSGSSTDTTAFSYTLVNDLLIIAMATGGFADTTTSTVDNYTFSRG